MHATLPCMQHGKTLPCNMQRYHATCGTPLCRRAEIREAFDLFDTEKTGRMDYHELKVRACACLCLCLCLCMRVCVVCACVRTRDLAAPHYITRARLGLPLRSDEPHASQLGTRARPHNARGRKVCICSAAGLTPATSAPRLVPRGSRYDRNYSQYCAG